MAKNKKNKNVEEAAIESFMESVTGETVETDDAIIEEESTVITDTVIGIVEGCTKLNIREADEPKAKVVCVVTNGSELTVDLTKSNPDWLNVETPDGKTGYCMAKYVSLGK